MHTLQTKASENKSFNLIAALGIVFGDIGTSPIYAFKQCFVNHIVSLNTINVLGLISLIFWTITLIVSVKYTLVVMRAENHGEGGILSLVSLVSNGINLLPKSVIILCGMIGAALFYGDGIITPAISVLGALEGMLVISPSFEFMVIPLTVIVLIWLFSIQKKGTKKIGDWFGYVMLVWFLTIGIAGLVQIIFYPKILAAANPWYAVHFIFTNPWVSFVCLSFIFLCITGAEALYADMGHFNRRTIQFSWFMLVYPCLLLNYFGQGALVLMHPASVANPFYNLVPLWMVSPLIVLSTLATIIASQSIISGIFSITSQGINLGYLPRMRILHTSALHIGQIYIPTINFILGLLTVLAVLIFRNSNNLATAYGLTVSGIMLITTILTFILAIDKWKWPLYKVLPLFLTFIVIEILFFISNLTKLLSGASFSLLFSMLIFFIIKTWMKGRKILHSKPIKPEESIKLFLPRSKRNKLIQVPGTGVYLTGNSYRIPKALMMTIDQLGIYQENIILLSVITEDIPRVPSNNRIYLEKMEKGIYRVSCHYGFKETPDIGSIMGKIEHKGLTILSDNTNFFISKGVPVASKKKYLDGWEENLYIFLTKNAASVTEYFKLPHGHVFEIGVRYLV